MLDPVVVFGIPALLAAPGPTNALLATASATRAPIGGGRAIGTVVAGYLVAIGGLRLVGSPVLAATPALLPLIRLVLAAWLGVIAVRLWRMDGGAGGAGPIDGRRLFGTTLLNPKAAVFAFGVFPEGAEIPAVALWFAGLVAAIVVTGGLWWRLGRIVRPAADGSSRLVPRIASVVLAGFGLVLTGTTIAAVG